MGHKTNTNKFKRTEAVETIFSDPNLMKLEINNRKTSRKILQYLEIKPVSSNKIIDQRESLKEN